MQSPIWVAWRFAISPTVEGDSPEAPGTLALGLRLASAAMVSTASRTLPGAVWPTFLQSPPVALSSTPSVARAVSSFCCDVVWSTRSTSSFHGAVQKTPNVPATQHGR